MKEWNEMMSRFRCFRKGIACFFVVFLFLAFVNEAHSKEGDPHILILTSQPYHTKWFNSLSDSMTERLYADLSPRTQLSYEYITSTLISDDQSVSILMKLMLKKYSSMNLSAIVAVMPTSSQFLLQYGEKMFPDVPKVYALPAKGQIKEIMSRPGNAAVESVSDIGGTIERIRELFPQTEHLYVVSGMGADDLSYIERTREVIKERGWPRGVTYLTGVPSRELSEKLSSLPQHSAVLMLLYVRDRDGKPLTTVQVMEALAPRANAPIFGFYDTVMGLGIVGGRLTSAESYGEAIATAITRLIAEEGAGAPIKVTARIRDIYDWRQIEKWNIPGDRLPTGSDIRFRKISFWEQHRKVILLILGIIFLQAVLIIALMINLRRRHSAEADLRISEKQYRDIFENAAMGIYQSTTEGTWQRVNQTMAQMFGYQSPEEMINDSRDIRKLYVQSEDRVRFKKLFEEEEVVRGFQAEFKRRDGSRFWISIHGKAIRDDQGRILYYEGTVEDITVRKQAAAELARYRDHLEELVKERTAELEIAKEKAEAADRLKSAFLATMSHELRTPLNSIIGFTGIILQGIVGPLNEEQKKQLDMVRNSAQHLLSLINDVLDISKIEAGQLQVTSEGYDLRSTIEKAVGSARPLAEKKGLELSAVIDPRIGMMTGDRRRVEQVLLNLISNAIKFTEKGSVRIECEPDGDSVTIRVMDTGIGIKAEDMKKIFQAFRQIDSGMTRKYEGTGLGLSISKRLVELMEGKIRATSVWGSGSTFAFSLPMERRK